MKELPRILFITNEPPQTGAAGGIILYRLFLDYPDDRIRVVTNSQGRAECEYLSCKYFFLSLQIDRLNNTRLWWLRSALRCLGGARLVPLRTFLDCIDEFEPDIVVTVMQDCWYFSLAERVAKHLKKPLVMFGHDLSHGFEPVPGILRPIQRMWDRIFLRSCAKRLCVSPGMVKYFDNHFGVESSVLLPPRSPEPIRRDPEKCRVLKHSGQLTLGFAGGLHYGYGEQLVKMLPILRATKSRVEIFGPEPSQNLSILKEASDVFQFNGYVSPPEEAWRRLHESADVILQPYLNPPENHELQYRTHFPSKFGDCLALGLPLLVIGPEDSSGVLWCKRHPGATVCLTNSDPSELHAILERLRTDDDLRVQVARAGQKVSVEDFDLKKIVRMMECHFEEALTS